MQQSKEETYQKIEEQFKKFMEKYDQKKHKLSFEARMASLSSIVKQAFPNDLIFCGFYVVTKLKDLQNNYLNEEALEVGPYVSDVLATPRIDYGKGQCGQCWSEKKIQIEGDVSLCKNYIACDAETKSEIVIPVFKSQEDADANIVSAVWDIDSHKINRFDEIDVKYLSNLALFTYI